MQTTRRIISIVFLIIFRSRESLALLLPIKINPANTFIYSHFTPAADQSKPRRLNVSVHLRGIFLLCGVNDAGHLRPNCPLAEPDLNDIADLYII